MKEKTNRHGVGKKLAKCVVDLDTGKREVTNIAHSGVLKDILAWARQFKLAVRGLIRRTPSDKKTYTGKTTRDSAHDKQGTIDS